MKKQVLENPEKNQTHNPREFNTLVIVSCLLTTCYLTSNIMAVKVVSIFGISLFDAGTITFPLAYMLGDVLTEVWGFKTARKVIFLTFFCNLLLVICTVVGLYLPSPPEMADTTNAYAVMFSYVPRIVIASFLAFLAGELTNAWVLEWIKKITNGRRLWVRTIGSSIAGHFVDTVIFVPVAFLGTVPLIDIFSMILVQIAAKLLIEIIAGTPLAYVMIGFIKKRVKKDCER
jgi:uncharacterized integral membrane protein (TIGR00697 family)